MTEILPLFYKHTHKHKIMNKIINKKFRYAMFSIEGVHMCSPNKQYNGKPRQSFSIEEHFLNHEKSASITNIAQWTKLNTMNFPNENGKIQSNASIKVMHLSIYVAISLCVTSNSVLFWYIRDFWVQHC